MIALFGRQPKVGRTTAAVNLGILLGRAGRTAGLVHLDEGWPAAELLGRDEGASSDPVAVRSGLDLALVDPDVAVQDLVTSCRTWAAQRDFLILDLPAGSEEVRDGLLEVAEDVVLVVSPGQESLPGLAEDLAVITDVIGSSNPSLKVAGLLMSRADRDLKRFERFLLRIERHFPVEVFPFCIPTEDLPEGCVVESVPTGRRTRGYVELAMEVMDDGG